MILTLIGGFVLGYLLSMPPLGPTNVAVTVKAFKKETNEAIAIGAGAGFVDFFYILVAYGGVSLFLSFLPDSFRDYFYANQDIFIVVMTFIGCAVVIIYGFKIKKMKIDTGEITARQKEQIKDVLDKSKEVLHKTEENLEKVFHHKVIKKNGSSIFGNFLTGILLCISSVTLPASWIAIVTYFKGYNLISSEFLSGVLFGLGVFLGAVLWFYTWVKIISKNTHRIKPQALAKINIFVGYFLIALGGFLLYKAIDFTVSL
ncbi:MAG TPA: LysE family transporter [Ignavibacteria bacterium]|nr:LysE family transporter [Ignavibacteria bacterium]